MKSRLSRSLLVLAALAVTSGPVRAQTACTAAAPRCTELPDGLQNRTGYATRLSDDQLKKQLAARPTSYLVGQLDTLPLAGFDASCPAMAQGANRLARGQAFGKYVNQKFGARHTVAVIPLSGHNARCMFTAEPALPVLFPKP